MGRVEITVSKEGFNPATVIATVAGDQSIDVALEPQTAIEEHVTVGSTRMDKRLEDQPMRVEVLDAEEIEEKQLMTPGDIVMMLNDMGGLRVQATVFSELTVRGTARRQTWVGGVAFERATLDPREHPAFAYAYRVPGVFAQDDVEICRWLTVSASGRVDVHSQFGTFVSPRVSALARGGVWSSRLSVGSGFFAPTPLTGETEAAGLARLKIAAPLKAERGRSASVDVTRSHGSVTMTGTLFRYDVRDPVVVDRATYTLSNLLPAPTISTGVEGITMFRQAPFSATATYTYVFSREDVGAARGDIPLTPRHRAGLVGTWERHDRGRVGLEAYVTGQQRLEDNPHRSESVVYVLFGALLERRFGRVRVFVNAEDLGNVRQSHWDALIRPFRAADGRWTVDAWAPLDGRVINGGVRLAF